MTETASLVINVDDKGKHFSLEGDVREIGAVLSKVAIDHNDFCALLMTSAVTAAEFSANCRRMLIKAMQKSGINDKENNEKEEKNGTEN